MAFQAAHHDKAGVALEVDGVVGRKTWGALRKPSSGSPSAGDRFVKLGDRGDSVVEVQSILVAQGFLTGEVSGTFDAATRDAVSYFQQSHLGRDGEFLEVDGVVGPNSWWALRHPVGAPQRSNIPAEPTEGGVPKIIPKGLTPLRVEQLKIVVAEHGVKEVPNGSNWGPGVKKYGGIKGKPWCCWFWSWGNKQVFGSYTLGGKLGRCMTAWNRANDRGMAHEKGDYIPIPGDGFVMLYRNGNGKFNGRGHIGYVLRTKVEDGKATVINTVEGNSANRVKIGRRKLSSKDIVGFINPFPPEEQPTGWETGVVQGAKTADLTTR
jgi:peptidoglycan hydrolase-like protein with peptidoglycan-binding domain